MGKNLMTDLKNLCSIFCLFTGIEADFQINYFF